MPNISFEFGPRSSVCFTTPEVYILFSKIRRHSKLSCNSGGRNYFMIKTNLGCELDRDVDYYSPLIVPYSLVKSAKRSAPVSPGAVILINLIQPASEHPKPRNAYCFK